MSELGTRERIALVTLLPAFLACFGLSVYQNLAGRIGYVNLTVQGSPEPDGYPVVTFVTREWTRRQSGLREGDRLIEAGGTSLRGAGPLSTHGRILEAAPPDRRVPILFEREGVRLETALEVFDSGRERRGLLLPLALGSLCTLVLVRAPRHPASLNAFVAGITYAIVLLHFPGGPAALTYAWFAVLGASATIFNSMLIITINEWLGRPTNRWARLWPWVFCVYGLFTVDRRIGAVFGPEFSGAAFLVATALADVVALACMIRITCRADLLQRRQIKWVLYTFSLAFVCEVAINLIVLFDPGLMWLRGAATPVLILLPVGLFMSIVRYDLFDIDRLISATTSYTLLGVVVVAGVLMVVPRAAQALGPAVGIGVETSQTLLSVVLAAVVVPAGRFLRPRVDRLFFSERYALREGIDRLLVEISESSSAQTLTQQVGERLDALLRPDLCAIYAPAGDAYRPVFARGRAVPPVCPAQGALIASLTGRRTPLDLGRLARRERGVPWSPAEQAFLDALGASVLLPVTRRDQLTAFLCLGSKRSGDIYTETDLAMLASVADSVTTQLRHFADTELLEQARAMQEELRRYVPALVARGLESPEDLETRECSVSVLFVDIRGYTSYTESHRAQQVFATINRYTQTVSSIVEKFGGSIVDFSGDGMMAVFGAPRALAEKERSAVLAGREIVTRVGSIGAAGEPDRISVGVGIATGAVFVGTVQAADRLIWSALGNTTNLAARLQSLTRELDAAIAIDIGTWRGAGDCAADFARRDAVAIRGRSHREDIYVLPRADGP